MRLRLLLAIASVCTPTLALAQSAGSPVTPQGYTYDPHGRRDPFVSLLRRGTDVTTSTAGPRLPGLSGLGTDEISLRGTVRSRDGFVAMVEGADKRTYIVRGGDRLRDGSVKNISADTLIVVQRVHDPLSPNAAREVRKSLRQVEEAR